MNIDGYQINSGTPPYIIAEMSGNHNGNINNAFRIIEMAARVGANAVKLQTYTADTLTIDSKKEDFQIKGGLWDGQTLYDLYGKAYTPWEWHKDLFMKAEELGITIFSSPFDLTAVDLLEGLNAPAYKIASFECIHLPLIKYVAQTGKPLIISTGMADKQEIAEAVEMARDNGCKDLALLHCVSAYPASSEDYNLMTLKAMAEEFDCPVGLSDHTLNNITAISSVALGARIIEKHVTLDRQGGGPDDPFSLEEAELAELCLGSETAWKALGTVNFSRKESEKANLVFRRSLYVVKDLKEGEILTQENVRVIRPGYGMHPRHYEEVLGMRAREDVTAGTALKREMLEGWK